MAPLSICFHASLNDCHWLQFTRSWVHIIPRGLASTFLESIALTIEENDYTMNLHINVAIQVVTNWRWWRFFFYKGVSRNRSSFFCCLKYNASLLHQSIKLFIFIKLSRYNFINFQFYKIINL